MSTADESGGAGKRIGIRDVAARAGVGIATVSRVLSGSADVRADLHARVVQAAADLDYEPDILAQSLRRGATRSCGFIADDLANHLIADIATGAESVLRGEGYSLLVMNSERDPTLDAANIRVLRSRRVDALMTCPVEESDPDTMRALRSMHVPLCVIEGDQPSSVTASYVHSDHRSGMGMALRHLVELGHRDIALLTGPIRYRSARERMRALEDLAAATGSVVRTRHVVTELTADEAEAATLRLLADDPPTALAVGGDRALLGVLRGIERAGVAMGTELSVVTSDPIPLSTLFRPPLAAITRDSGGIGRVAAQLMLERIQQPETPPVVVMLPTAYEPRASVGPPIPR